MKLARPDGGWAGKKSKKRMSLRKKNYGLQTGGNSGPFFGWIPGIGTAVAFIPSRSGREHRGHRSIRLATVLINF